MGVVSGLLEGSTASPAQSLYMEAQELALASRCLKVVLN